MIYGERCGGFTQWQNAGSESGETRAVAFRRWAAFFLFLGSSLCGCYPNTEVSFIQREALPADTLIRAATKAYLRDASVVLFPTGFAVYKGAVSGVSRRFSLSWADTALKFREFPLDSIVAMGVYEEHLPAGRVIASFVLGVYGSIMTPLSVYCLSCPKCCFGSCPTIYTFENGHSALAAELFSRSIAKTLEENDLRRLSSSGEMEGDYQVNVTNEALETHHINTFSLLAVHHPAGTEVFPRAGGGLSCVSGCVSPLQAVNRAGDDVLDLVKVPDGRSYRSEAATFTMVREGVLHDWLEMRVKVPEGSRSVTMVVRLRNTLLSTILLYDLVLGSQGMQALEWTQRMNTDDHYAARFKSVYDAFSGISVETQRGGQWVRQSFIRDTGPITWNWMAAEIPVDQAGELLVRLVFFPDNFLIDYVAFAPPHEVETTTIELRPTTIVNNHGVESSEIAKLIERDDDQYLVTNPGESYRFHYRLPRSDGQRTTLFVRSRGYYNEWIRGEWITMGRADYRFELSDISGTLSQLVQSWLKDRSTVEHAFWETKIPVKEDQ